MLVGSPHRASGCVTQPGQCARGSPRPSPRWPARAALQSPRDAFGSHHHSTIPATAAAASTAAVAVEHRAEVLRGTADAALLRMAAVGEVTAVPRDWVVETEVSIRRAAKKTDRLSLAWSPEERTYRYQTSGASSSNGNGNSDSSSSSSSSGSSNEVTVDCQHCRYPCHTTGLPACQAAEYLRMWDADSFLKPAFFDSSCTGALPNSSDLAVLCLGGRCGGRWKAQNQDNFLVHAFHPSTAQPPQLRASSGGARCGASPAAAPATVVGVFDGHGTLGAVASRLVKESMQSALAARRLPIAAADAQAGDTLSQDAAEESLRQLFSLARERVEEDGRDFSKSGSTAVLCMVLRDRIVTAWAGDSRAVVGVRGKAGGGYQAHGLSRDHKPDSPSELARISAAGGRVDRLATDKQGNPIGPYRVFLPGHWAPGLAVARAFGDTMASSIGVVPTPEFTTFTLPTPAPIPSPAPAAPQNSSSSGRQGDAAPLAPHNARHLPPSQLLIVASDGLWEWVPSQRAVEIAGAAATAEDAAHALVEAAQKEWALKYRGRNCDDITVAVAFI